MMIKSMTAFARSQLTTDAGIIVWEIRSVNHRYLDVNLRLPDDFRSLEGKYREQVNRKLSRGKIECTLRFKPVIEISDQIEIDETFAKSVVDACQRVNNILHQPSAINPIEVLSWPGVIRETETDLAPVFEASEKLLDEALSTLVQNRESEGQRILDMIKQRCASIKKIVMDTREALPEIQSRYKEKLLLRLDELKMDVDQSRLEQELVHMAHKMDVDEELDRLDSHLQEICDVLERNEAIGRRLDFLMQEFNREANTLGSKSVDITSTQSSVELKVLIEQMREQIQNIE